MVNKMSHTDGEAVTPHKFIAWDNGLVIKIENLRNRSKIFS